MTFKVIRDQGQGEEMTSVAYRDYFYRDFLTALVIYCGFSSLLDLSGEYTTVPFGYLSLY